MPAAGIERLGNDEIPLKKRDRRSRPDSRQTSTKSSCRGSLTRIDGKAEGNFGTNSQQRKKNVFFAWGLQGAVKMKFISRVMRDCLAQGKTAILLVPEISNSADLYVFETAV